MTSAFGAPRPAQQKSAFGRNPRRAFFLVTSAVLVLGVVVWAHEVLFPFVLALVVAYVLTPAVRWAEERRVARWAAIALVYAITLGALGAGLAEGTPRLAREMRDLLREAPAMAARAKTELPSLRHMVAELSGIRAGSDEAESVENDAADPSSLGAPAGERPPPLRVVKKGEGTYEVELGPGIEVEQVGRERWRVALAEPAEARPFEPARFLEEAAQKAVAYGRRNTLEVIRLGHTIVSAVWRTVFLFFMTLMLAAYIMLTREKIIDFFRALVKRDARPSFDQLLARVDRGLAGVVRGQLVICMVNGALSAIGFWFFGLKHWPILALVAAVMSLIPIFGSILSSIPIVAVALTQSLGTAFEVLVWIIGIHQLEANLLNPKIIGDAAKIHPVLVIFALLAGEHFFGLPGALLAVPVMSIAQSIFLHFRELALADDAGSDGSVLPTAADATEPGPPSERPVASGRATAL